MANEATVQEMEELDRLIQQNEEWERLIDELNTTESQNAPTDDTDAALTAHLVKMELTGRLDEPEKLGISAYTIPQTQSIRRKKWMWAAAAIFLLA